MARIAFVLPNLAGGGAERVTLTLLKYFLALDHRVDLVVCTGTGELLELVPPEVQIFDLRARRFRSALWPLIRYFATNKPDAVQVSMWPLTVIAIIARMFAAATFRLVVVDHTTLSLVYPSGIRRHFLRWSARVIYPFADVRGIVSSGAADDLARFSGINRNSIEVLYNPVEPPNEEVNSEAAESLWGTAKERILTVGSLKPDKNHALLLKAFSYLLKKRPAARLIILGEGSLRPELARQVADLKLEGSVLMPGFVIDPSPFYRSADLFVLSSAREGLPTVLIEALYAGLRIVSTDCLSGPREILEDGRYGLLVPCNDSQALSQAMDEVFSVPNDATRGRRRADELAGAKRMSRYSELLLPGCHSANSGRA